MEDALGHVTKHGDLAHFALFLWASGASSLLVWALRQLAAVNERFSLFTSEIARFNRLVGSGRQFAR